jgi:hypothetical protein
VDKQSSFFDGERQFCIVDARTLSLQTFFSEHGGTSETEQGREDLGRVPEMIQPELSTEDLVPMS